MKEITIEDVRSFLDSVNVKIDVYGMVFAERQRCQETMRADFPIQYPFK